MKPLLGPSLLFAATALFLTGCDPDSQTGHQPPKKTGPGGFSTPVKHESRPSETTDTSSEEAPPPKEKEHRDRTPQAPDPTPPAPSPKVAAGAPLYGKPVPGKPGFVTSPYKPGDGQIDVRGYGPGTELQDPYAEGHTFLVPAQ